MSWTGGGSHAVHWWGGDTVHIPVKSHHVLHRKTVGLRNTIDAWWRIVHLRRLSRDTSLLLLLLQDQGTLTFGRLSGRDDESSGWLHRHLSRHTLHGAWWHAIHWHLRDPQSIRYRLSHLSRHRARRSVLTRDGEVLTSCTRCSIDG